MLFRSTTTTVAGETTTTGETTTVPEMTTSTTLPMMTTSTTVPMMTTSTTLADTTTTEPAASTSEPSTTTTTIAPNGRGSVEQLTTLTALLPDTLAVNNGSMATKNNSIACSEDAVKAHSTVEFATLSNLASNAPDIVLGAPAGWETDDEFVYAFDLPGVPQDRVTVEAEDGTLTVTAERERSVEVPRERYHRSERRFGTFARTVGLPQGAATDAIRATFKDGVLEVRLPIRKAETQVAKVPITKT